MKEKRGFLGGKRQLHSEKAAIPVEIWPHAPN
jgi:hypothetical protein